MDDRHRIFDGDIITIDSTHQVDQIIGRAELGIFFLDLARGEGVDGLDLDTVENSRKEFLPPPKTRSYGNPDDHTGLILAGFIAQTNRHRLTPIPQHFLIKLGIEVESKHCVADLVSDRKAPGDVPGRSVGKQYPWLE